MVYRRWHRRTNAILELLGAQAGENASQSPPVNRLDWCEARKGEPPVLSMR